MKILKLILSIILLTFSNLRSTDVSLKSTEASSDKKIASEGYDSIFYSDDTEQISEALKSGMDINKKDQNGWTCLHWAVFFKRTKVVEFLINSKADLNIRVPDEKNTALIIAVSNENLKIVKLLVQGGADKTLKNEKGETALDIAKVQLDITTVKLDEEKKQYEQFKNLDDKLKNEFYNQKLLNQENTLKKHSESIKNLESIIYLITPK